jgi:flagellar basal-body rod modification protein FlgD
MDVRHMNSMTGVGSPAATRVASSLSSQSGATNKTSGAAKPRATSSGAGSSASSAASDSADITSSDFLTLLVSELQNQDPTQPADPNAYITQLVQVNSLQQLIQINQTGQQAAGDSVALLNDIDYTVDPNSTVAVAPSGSSSASGSGSPSGSSDAVRSREIAHVETAFGMQSNVDPAWSDGVTNQ